MTMNDEELYELDKFTSDDGKHEVEWLPWDNEEYKATYNTWVCTTHNKLYYADCIFDAQI